MKIILSLILCVCITLSSFADKFKKVDTMSYRSNGNTTVKIINKHGNIETYYWDKDTIEIKTILTVNSTSRERASRMFRLLDVDTFRNRNEIKLITDIHHNFNTNEPFSINYVIHLPKNVKLNLDNAFGDIFIQECLNKLNINQKHGELYIGKINSHIKSNIKIKYVNAYIDSCKTCNLDSEYSKIKINKIDTLINNSKFSKLKIDYIKNIISNSNHDLLNISKVDSCYITKADNLRLNIDTLLYTYKSNANKSINKINFIHSDFVNIIMKDTCSSNYFNLNDKNDLIIKNYNETNEIFNKNNFNIINNSYDSYDYDYNNSSINHKKQFKIKSNNSKITIKKVSN